LGILPLKPPVGAVEIFAAEHRSPPATALVFHAAAVVVARVAYRQPPGDQGCDIHRRRKVINRHAVRTNVGGPDALTPCGIRPASRAVDAEAAVL